ncbi:hypothetical protein HK097_005698 [Rhizophlyctis rosea]|uniref:Isopenicillin N synthase-like Fe(2+) 2OG dioxygenase domain-containing protein n=1 Tax=Rhizophlyctis rosea TaxID=64517 RepID=A0AAD5SE59_9FUNG|nr:hypothetical protein HK097_005698 [Rhizophlyctis rosea]
MSSTLQLPTIDLIPFLDDPSSDASLAECRKAAEALQSFSALTIRDPRVSEEHNSVFLDMMEEYFAQSTEAKEKDARPEVGFQVGVTPENKEVPRCGKDERCKELVEKMEPENQPLNFDGPDPKWRFFWRIGETPKETKYPQLNADPVVPAGFPQWREIMDGWGGRMHEAISTLSEMLAIGFDLPRDTFTQLTKGGPHLLAPTGSDLSKYGKVGTVLAGFHTDLNFLTIHGKSRFPGLHVWTKDGRKMLARVPDGCLLVQAGKQMEWFTGGAVTAGFHEVVVLPQTVDTIEVQKARNRPLWRISSTLFFHTASDNLLQPLNEFDSVEARQKYPKMPAGKQVQIELGFISLMSNKDE